MSTPQTVICTYRVKPGDEEAFQALLRTHWPTLRRQELVTAEPPRMYRRVDDQGRTTFVEIFAWKDGSAAGVAHETPEVMAVWEPMGGLVEARDGRPAMEFPHFEPLDLELAEV